MNRLDYDENLSWFFLEYICDPNDCRWFLTMLISNSHSIQFNQAY